MERMSHMDYECKDAPSDALKAYKDFMCNPCNAYNCAECPERGISTDGLPCGQQNCWVLCHCN